MQNAKAPGPDGFTVKFFKRFGDKLLPSLLTLFEESVVKGQLPPMFSLILKKGKDPLSCGSYHPISLLNVDCKLLAKVLAHHLEATLPSIISPNQICFTKKTTSLFLIFVGF